jgi:hypothetical protein
VRPEFQDQVFTAEALAAHARRHPSCQARQQGRVRAVRPPAADGVAPAAAHAAARERAPLRVRSLQEALQHAHSAQDAPAGDAPQRQSQVWRVRRQVLLETGARGAPPEAHGREALQVSLLQCHVQTKVHQGQAQEDPAQRADCS